MIIGIGHKKGTGKDTVADRLVDKHRFIKLSFARNLKEAARIIFGLNDRELYGDLKEIVLPEWNKTPRELLTLLGTDACRNVIDNDIWIKSMHVTVNKLIKQKHNIVIPDVRFPNEADFILSLGGDLWKTERKIDSNEFSNHISETALDSYDPFWNTVIKNDGSLQDLYNKVDVLMKSTGVKHATIGKRNIRT